jgi:hypothetical protein
MILNSVDVSWRKNTGAFGQNKREYGFDHDRNFGIGRKALCMGGTDIQTADHDSAVNMRNVERQGRE